MFEKQSRYPSITFEGVTAAYGVGSPIFKNSTFEFGGPGLVRLRGRNGSGKSTFAELVSGYLRPSSGSVRVSGQEACDPKVRARRRVCRAEAALFGQMTVRDHLVLACSARSLDSVVVMNRAVRLGLEPWLHESAAVLSTGTSRKLWFAMNTVGDFDVLVLDEPFNGVDADGVNVMVEEVEKWARSSLVVVVTHSLTQHVQRVSSYDLEDLRGI